MKAPAPNTALGEAQSPTGLPPLALVCLGELAWKNSWKRNQSMIYQLSRLPLFERVVFVDPRPVWFRDELLHGRGNLLQRLGGLFRAVPHVYDHKIRICGLTHFMPFKERYPRFRVIEDQAFHALLRLLRGGRPYVLLNNHPDFVPASLLHLLMGEAALRVFDLSDDFEEFYEDASRRTRYRANIEYNCTHSDIVLAVNEHVQQKYRVYNPETYEIPNGTNFWNFHRTQYESVPFLERIRASKKPILGHSGTINRIRLDYELLEQVAHGHPEWQFVFVGSADPSFLEVVARHPNLHYHPSVAYQELPNWIHAFDLGIVPFRVNEHTRGNDLLKFNDYFAMGKGLVTTDMGGAHKYRSLIWVASDADSFAASIAEALAGEPPEMRERRQQEARNNSWEDRARAVQTLIVKHMRAQAAAR